MHTNVSNNFILCGVIPETILDQVLCVIANSDTDLTIYYSNLIPSCSLGAERHFMYLLLTIFCYCYVSISVKYECICASHYT
jgi:hypothetical protein